MKLRYFLILTIFLVYAFGCQVNSQEKSRIGQSSANQKDAAPPARDNSPLKLTLNREAAGTTQNTSILSERLEKIFKDREKNGVFREDSSEVEKSVYLSADRSVSAEEIAGLFGVLNATRANPILIPVPLKEEADAFPNPLALVVHAGSGETRPAHAGIEVGFVGELSENPSNTSGNKNPVLVAAAKNGTYMLDGKQMSTGDLKTAIEKRLKTKEKGKRAVFVQAEGYGNLEDAAAIAASTGAGKVYFVTKNSRHQENDISFSLPPAFVKDTEQTEDLDTIAFNGPDYSSFEITLHDELIDKERAETEISFHHESRKEMFKPSQISRTEIDGSPGVLTIRNEDNGFIASWFGFRRKGGKHQAVLMMFSCGRAGSGFCNSEFLQIIRSIKFN